MMTPVKLLIFDLDGTLIDSRQDIAASVNRTFRDLNLPPKPDEIIYRYVGNGVRRLIIEAVESEEPALVDRALQIFEGHYLAHLLEETSLYPGILEMFSHFKDKKKGMATNKPTLYTERIIKGLGIEHYFDVVLGGTPPLQLKPHPDMLLKILHTLGIAPEDAIMVGDSFTDIQAARAAGIRSCAVGYGLVEREALLAASPDFFVETAMDLARLFR